MATKRKPVRKTRQTEPGDARALHAALDALPLAFALFDAKRRLVGWNARLASLELFPKRLLAPGTDLESLRTHDKGLSGRTAKPRELHLPTGVVLRATAQRIGARQLLVTWEDVTEARRVAERLELVERAVSEGLFDWDIAGDRVVYSERAMRQFFSAFGLRGFRQNLTGRQYVALLHPEDRERYNAEVLAHLKGSDERFECEFRLQAGGRTRWMRQHGTTIRDAQGRAIRMIGAAADITERKEAELALERAHAETAAALERQTATAEILKVISQSPDDLQPVFGAILERATRLCEAELGFAFTCDGQAFDLVAQRGLEPERIGAVMKALGQSRLPGPETALGVIQSTRRLVHIPDVTDTAAYRAGDPLRVSTADLIGARTLLAVPLLRDRTVVGAVIIYRREVRPFSDKQLALLQTFADQAVIAIENVRLFNELGARNRELSEALERQTATAAILKVISESPTDVQPVFNAIVESASRLFARKAALAIVRDGALHMVAMDGVSREEFDRTLALYPMALDQEASKGFRAMRAGKVLEITDVEAPGTPGPILAAARTVGYRALVTAPLMRGDAVLGQLNLGSDSPQQKLDEKQRALVQTFADQAVIAIENVRLFNETKEALERQTATAEVLQVISSSVADTAPVFDKIIRSCEKLFGVRWANVALVRDDGQIDLVHDYGRDDLEDWEIEGRKFVQTQFPRPVGESIHGYAIRKGEVLHYPDVENGPDVPQGLRAFNEIVRARFAKLGREQNMSYNYSVMYAPMFWEGKGIGAIGVHRVPPAPFAEKDIRLLKTFADQASIAIQNARLFNETKEALERQTATSEILKVISESPTDTQPVFDAIAESARKLFGDAEVGMTLIRGEAIELVAAAGLSKERLGALRASFPRPLDLVSTVNKTVVDGQLIHYPDVLAEDVPAYSRDTVKAAGMRAMLGVPLLREGRSIGGVFLSRATPGAYTEHQIALLRTFADQAVIAIENVRLFNETKEALERQTATAEILKVISESPTDVQPVFDAIVGAAVRLIGCDMAFVQRRDSATTYSIVAGATPQGLLSNLAPDQPLDAAANFPARAMLSGQVLHLPDWSTIELPPHERNVRERYGIASALYVPMLRKGECIGVLTLAARRHNHFGTAQIALAESFRDQAVIAIENVRLFNETKEALERQTATAEILKVISESPTDVQPVFDSIARSAASLFGCKAGITLLEGRSIDLKAIADGNATDEEMEARFKVMKKTYPVPFDPERNLVSRAIATASTIETADTEAPEAGSSIVRELGRAGGFRSLINVPLTREGSGIGAIALAFERPGVRLNDRQRTLVQTFADQAVIAIENVRLFKELEERTEALTKSVGQLTALGEVSQTLSSTLDLDKVLQTIVSRAVQLSGLDAGAIYEYDEERAVFNLRGGESVRQEIVELNRDEPVRIGEGAIGRAAEMRQPVQVADLSAGRRQTRGRDVLLQIGARALLAVPLLREGHILGALAVTRNTPGEFPPEVIALLETFAGQSAIAIQNARLFREIEDKSRQLELASQHKSQFLASMSHELRTPLNAILGFNELILGGIYGDIAEDMRPPLEQMQSSGKHLLGLINNVLDLAKIEANKMELALADYAVQDTVAMVRSTLQALAAEKGLDFVVSAPEDLPLAYGDGGRLSQCLINLAGNAIKFTKQGRVEIRVALEDETLRFTVSDTGIGIAPDKIDNLFTEFKQTDAAIASEYGGTGLGLAITKKFIEMHGGRIWIESELGKGSRFIFEIPLRVQAGVTA